MRVENATFFILQGYPFQLKKIVRKLFIPLNNLDILNSKNNDNGY